MQNTVQATYNMVKTICYNCRLEKKKPRKHEVIEAFLKYNRVRDKLRPDSLTHFSNKGAKHHVLSFTTKLKSDFYSIVLRL